MQRLTLTGSGNNTSLIIVDPLATSLNVLVEDAKNEAVEQHQKDLISLRKPVIKFIKDQLNFLKSLFSTLNQHQEKYIYDLIALIDPINDDNLTPTDAQWVELIEYHKSNKIESVSYKGIKLFWSIRHKFIEVFQEDSELRDTLDTLIDDINKRKSFAEEDSQVLIDHLYQLSYYVENMKDDWHYKENKEPLTVENIKALLPAFEVLLAKGLFTKANFLRLLIRPHYNVEMYSDRENKLQCNYYDHYYYHFYMYPLIPHEFINRFIIKMNSVNVVHQQNIEVLIKILFTKTTTNSEVYGGWDPESLYKLLLNWCESLKLSKHNDRFSELMYEFKRELKGKAIDEAEQQRINRANNTTLNNIKKEKVKAHLTRVLHQELTQLQLPAGEEDNESSNQERALTILTSESDVLRIRSIEEAQRNIDDIAELQTILQDDNISSVHNLSQMVVHSKNAKHITEAYQLIKNTDAFATPQEALDAVMKVADYSESVSSAIKWLRVDQFSPENIKTILEEAFYTEDFVYVTQFQEKCFSAKDEEGKNITAEYLFAINFIHKKEFLSALATIYRCVEKNNLSAGHAYTSTHDRLPLTKPFANLLSQIPKDEAVNTKRFYDLLSQCEEQELADRKSRILIIQNTLPADIATKLIKYKYNLTINLIDLIDGYLLLKANNLLRKWKHIIDETDDSPIQLSSAYAAELAGCLVTLHEKQILLPENAAMLLHRRELCVAVTSILLKLHEHNQLNDDTREKLKLNIHKAVQISKFCEQINPIHLKQLLSGKIETKIDLSALKNEPEWYGLDEDAQPQVNKEKELTSISMEQDNASDDDSEEEIVVTAKPASQQVSGATSTSAIPNNTESKSEDASASTSKTTSKPKDDSDAISPQELIKRCRVDYNNTFFGRSNFSVKLASREIDRDNLQQMIEYMKQNPRSRTTRVYVHMYVEKLKAGAYKDFWQKYLKSYTFSFYQKSELINKLLDGAIHQLEDVKQHAAVNKSNRTTRLLRTYK